MEKTAPQYLDMLSHYRQVGDPEADNVISQICTDSSIHPPFDTLGAEHPVLTAFFAQNAQLPNWADWNRMKMGIQFFHKHVQDILPLLGFHSLPYCYAGADGAKVLIRSKRILEDTAQRLMETGKFVLDITDEENFKNGQAFRTILGVRLLHAYIRYQILKYPGWETGWGYPINQEDMLGTNFSFSLIVTRGLRKLNRSFTAKELGDYLHFWNVIGFLSGIDKELLPDDAKAAFHLERAIVQRNFRYSEEGERLTAALIKALTNANPKQPIDKNTISRLIAYFVGDQLAPYIGLEPARDRYNTTGIAFSFAQIVQGFNGFRFDLKRLKREFNSQEMTYPFQVYR